MRVVTIHPKAAKVPLVKIPPQATTQNPNKIAEVVIVNGSEPESLDPQKASDAGSFNIHRQMFVGLTASDETGKTIPNAASEWTTADNKTWVFKLRNDMKWSDGKPLNANDFVYALRRLVDPATASPYGSYLVDAKLVNAEQIADGKAKPDTLGVKAIDDYTLEITTKDAVPYLPDLMMLPATFATPSHAIQAHGDKWIDPANIVVSGAYKLSEVVVGSHIILKRNEAYFDNANTHINSVAFLPTTAQASMARYQTGEVDVSGVPAELYKDLKAKLPDEVKTTPVLCTSYLEYNVKKKPVDDVRVRKAISMTIDRDILTKEVEGRGELSVYQITPPYTQGMTEVKPDWANLSMEERSKQAVALLEEAGYTAENPLQVEFLYSTSEAAKRLTTAMESIWKQRLPNAKFSTVNQEWKMFLDTRRNGDFQVSFSAWCADYNEPSTFLNILRSKSSNNQSFYANREFDSLLDSTLTAEATADSRTQAYVNAERILQKDLPIAPIDAWVHPTLIKPYLKGYTHNDPLQNWRVEDWQIAQ